jgi:hypothetical protein
MVKQAPKVRLKELKIAHRKQRIVANKYADWLSASFPMLELYSGQYVIGDWFRQIS